MRQRAPIRHAQAASNAAVRRTGCPNLTLLARCIPIPSKASVKQQVKNHLFLLIVKLNQAADSSAAAHISLSTPLTNSGYIAWRALPKQPRENRHARALSSNPEILAGPSSNVRGAADIHRAARPNRGTPRSLLPAIKHSERDTCPCGDA